VLALAGERERRTAVVGRGVDGRAVLDEHARDPLSGNAVLNGMPIEMMPMATK
jgi:hypothetical protein